MAKRQRAMPGQAANFIKSASLSNSEDCIIWPYGIDKDGYGNYRSNGLIGAHVVSLFLRDGKKPEGAICLHSCHNPSCVNPNHLRWGTNVENIRDAIDAGRNTRGESQHLSKLSSEAVVAIRIDQRPNTEIAKAYGVEPCTIGRVKKRLTWKHV